MSSKPLKRKASPPQKQPPCKDNLQEPSTNVAVGNTPAVFKTKVDECPEQSYAVEQILQHKLVDNNLVYVTSWIGYPASENSDEPESSFLSYLPVYNHWLKVLTSTDPNEPDKNLALGGSLQHELQADKIRFFMDDSKLYKMLITDSIGEKYGWLNVKAPFEANKTFPDKNGLLSRYNHIVTSLSHLAAYFPDIQVVNEVDGILPLNINNLMWFNLDAGTELFPFDKGPDVFHGLIPAEEAIDKATMTLMKLKNFARLSATERDDIVCQKNFMQFQYIPFQDRTLTPLRCSLLVRRHPEHFWEFITLCDIEAGEHISPICGEIVDISVAAACFKEDGAMIAFPHFLRIPGESKCLDRRRRSDFTRYIHHSCNPNCEVKSVHVQSSVHPDVTVLYLVALRPIPRNAVLSLNLYKGLPRGSFRSFHVNWEKRSTLEAQGYSHIWCTCDSDIRDCRGVLWVGEKAGEQFGKKAGEPFKFHGLDVVS